MDEKNLNTENLLTRTTKDDEITWIDTTATTERTQKIHRIKWTLKNFSQFPLNTKVVGPYFYLTQNCHGNISLKKEINQIYLYLTNKSDQSSIKIERECTLCDCNGKVCFELKFGKVYELEKNVDKDIIGSVSSIMNNLNLLTNNVLVINCAIKLQNGVLTTEINKLQLTVDSRSKCLDHFKQLYEEPYQSDVRLKVGEEVISAHWLILCTRSPYFKQMFESEMKERIENTVVITDISFLTLKKLIEFLYTGTIEFDKPIDINYLYDLYYTADKYQVSDLQKVCANIILSEATMENIFQILKLANTHNDIILKTLAMQYVSHNFNELAESEIWESFVTSDPKLAAEVVISHTKKFQYF
ncbi:TD and POZ domain-containing protein 2 [Caerostris darwini]|uniref:TD and POZ domain-containing protein 2 n=1 Tax=Caerostris darwini TaxID=1538125 RepID=A0AAV4QDR3_9ARAC|nr:TD and POZ domain-containing protein 2 [Caerostris darwini]